MESEATNSLAAVRGALAGVGGESSPVALQSTVATAKETVSRTLAAERVAGDAALSLAQREQLTDLQAELEEAEQIFAEALTDRGRSVLGKAEPPKTPLRRWREWRKPSPAPRKWEDALADALESLVVGADLLTALASGQPDGTAARTIAESTASLLRDHQSVLQEASSRWLH